MAHVDDVVRPDRRFAPDPLNPGRERYWDSWHWTARVLDPDGTERLHWAPEIAALPRPPAPDVPTALALPLRLGASDPTADPVLGAVGDQPRPFVPEANVPGSRRKRLVLAIGAVAATLLIGAGAAAGAGVLTPGDQRPRLASELAYRDADAGFALRYPEGWRVLRRERGNAIRFAVAAPGAPTTKTNTVSVVVGTNAADLPALHTLVEQLTEMLRQQLPGVRLESAARTRVVDAPGFRFAFRDPDSSPATRIEQYVGKTAAGRPLTVTVTVREPRTAPTHPELHEFLASLQSSGSRATR